jgi:hypothetical protein
MGMGKYALKNKSGEIINTISWAPSHSDAVDMFANTKKLTTEQLLKIFLVEIVS